MHSKPKQYRGALTPSQAAEGIALARANDARLIADSELLLKNKRHASASALAILAIEELGKVQIIKTIVLHGDEVNLKRAWKDFRSHRAKSVQWILPKLAAEGARTLMELRVAADPEGDHTAMLDSVKQLSIYTDCFSDAPRWSEPADAVDMDFAAGILTIAKMLNRDEEITVRELELWTAIVGPHYDKSTMIDALLEFQRQVFAEGLSKTTPEIMEDFIRGGGTKLEN
ncbi:MAG: AbiV family abortive infection protein [Oceanibaculum nanhaiense]|jgi:AbiV family abortive infection protein|uniref:AbiV family abortive infection protein n=1 Tax=Oceanibaculum nanhaiense TaxID=1909734 RepID=UPI0032EB77C4